MKRMTALMMALVLALGCVPALAENTKHERVYVIASPDGTVQSLTDNIRLENADGLEEIIDRTMLKAIENVGGSESFARSGEALIWHAAGNDIIYQGISNQAPAIMPVVTLTLDGEEITAQTLKEKSGEAVLTVSYQAEAPLPALALSLLPLPETGVTELQLENAAVISVMGRRVLVGWAVPGVDAAWQLPAAFTASFHAEHADLDWMMTLLTSDPIDAACMEIEARMENDLQAELKEMQALLTALQKGEALPSLSGKTQEIGEKINALHDGLTQLNTGAASLDEGAGQVSEGASALKEGTADMVSGLAEMASGASALADGAAQAETGAASLDTGLAALTENNAALTDGAQAIFMAVLSSANEQLAASGLEIPALTMENYAAVLETALSQMNPEALQAAAGAQGNADGALAARLAAAQAAYESLSALKAELDQVSLFVTGVQEYTAGVSQAAQGAKSLHTGLTELNTGASSLPAGTDALSKGASALSEGVTALHEGALALAEGASALYAEGTEKMMDALLAAEKEAAERLLPYVSETLPEALRIYEETRDNAKNSGYDLRPEGMKTVTVYIIRTDLQK